MPKKTKLTRFKIAGGNPTLLAWGYSDAEKKNIVRTYLGEVEQVGFVATTKRKTSLEMMGNELCINATLALASHLKNEKLTTSANNVLYTNLPIGLTQIKIALPYLTAKNTVLLPNIGYVCIQSASIKKINLKSLKIKLRKLAENYNKPAFGQILYENNRILPFVYVKKTDTLFKETACGSGSIAFNLITNISEVIQPTGRPIFITRTGNEFTVRAKVDIIEEIKL